MNKILTVTANPAVDRVYFVDNFSMGDVHRPWKSTVSAGGKGINVSRVSRILGADVIATGFLGGYTGEFIRSEIKKIGICDCFININGETRICTNITDKTGASGEILEKGPVVTKEDEEKFMKLFKERVKECAIVVASGSLPDGLTSDFYCKIAKIAIENNKKIIIDTSGKNLEEILKFKPFMVKPNKDEFLKFTGQDAFDTKKALLFLKQQGVQIPFISLGKDGAVAMIDEAFYHFSVPAIDVVNAVGSGDSTVAGIATGISRGMCVLDAIRLGMAAGMSNTQFEATGFVKKEAVEAFYHHITITKSF